MGFPSFFFIKYKLSDLVEVTALQNMTIAELRNKVEILVIDDQDFAAEEYLIKNGFRIVHKRDIDNIRDVSAYAVVLCDIRGVGKNLGSTKEGAFVIKEIKAHYPAKQVIAYTGSSYDPAYNEYMNLADAVISKGISIEDWTALVDEQIQKAVDPIYQWERLRKHLLECGVSTAYVAKLETVDGHILCNAVFCVDDLKHQPPLWLAQHLNERLVTFFHFLLRRRKFRRGVEAVV